MKFLFLLLLTGYCLLTRAQDIFHGDFEGVSNNSAVRVSFNQQGQQVTGKYIEPENAEAEYNITGTVTQNVLKGKLINVSNPILQFKFTCIAENNTLRLSLDNSFWAALMPPVSLKRIENEPAGPTAGSSTDGKAPEGFDTRLIGKWVYTEYPTTGELRGIYAETMVISSSGQVTYYEPTFQANTADAQATSSPGKLVGTLQLKTRDKKLYAVHPQTSQEVFIADYIVDATRLMTTDPSKKRQLWHKR